MSKSTTTAQRVLATLRKIYGGGGSVLFEKVERIIPRVHTRRDLFKIIDILAITNHDTIGIQTCALARAGDHFEKLREERATRLWLAAPGRRLQLWSWRKLKAKRGGVRVIWTPRIQEIVLAGVDHPRASAATRVELRALDADADAPLSRVALSSAAMAS